MIFSKKALEGCYKSDTYSVFYEYSHFHNNSMLEKKKKSLKSTVVLPTLLIMIHLLQHEVTIMIE